MEQRAQCQRSTRVALSSRSAAEVGNSSKLEESSIGKITWPSYIRLGSRCKQRWNKLHQERMETKALLKPKRVKATKYKHSGSYEYRSVNRFSGSLCLSHSVLLSMQGRRMGAGRFWSARDFQRYQSLCEDVRKTAYELNQWGVNHIDTLSRRVEIRRLWFNLSLKELMRTWHKAGQK
jgi:hypothetical protein